ncbi:putative transcriptional regulator ngg1 [Diplodia seriata]|uniref:Putative transcriptional regulator ngg1 n=1 Tax=Diplodia seriata TaxID=420778 RepID=A0A0G2ET73_9PEZI|nr:putative transcriptional regulator ngg1 [Diplodia seriata]
MPSAQGKGKGKTGSSSRDARRSRSRNTTPISSVSGVHQSVEPVTTSPSGMQSTLNHLGSPSSVFIEDIFNNGGHNAGIPSPEALHSMLEEVKNRFLPAQTTRSEANEKFMRHLMQRRKARLEHQHAEERADREAEERKHKLKKAKKREPDEDRPLATFGPDPTKFDDPTIYHIRDITDDTPEELKKEILGVARYPQSELKDLTPGTPPDKDFSNPKPQTQVNASVFANYVEPYVKPLTEEDLSFLKERQEYCAIEDDLNNQLNAAYLKRNRNLGKGKKNSKRPGGAGGGSHAVVQVGAGNSRGLGEEIRALMEKKERWTSVIGPVVDYGKAGIPKESIFDEELMKKYMEKEQEGWTEVEE